MTRWCKGVILSRRIDQSDGHTTWQLEIYDDYRE